MEPLVVICVLKMLQAFGYYSICIVLTSFLSDDFGLSDTTAGTMYGVYGMLISVYSLLIVPLITACGVRKAFMLGTVVTTIARVMLGTTTDVGTVRFVLFCVMPLGECLSIPVLAQAVGDTCTPETRKWNFSMYYTSLNVALVFVGPTVDMLRSAHALTTFFDTTPYRLLVYMSACCGMISLAIVSITTFGAQKNIRTEENTSPVFSRALTRDPKFRRFVTLVMLLVGVRVMLRHLDATFPKYVVRALGPAAPYGALWSINPATIIMLVPLLSAFSVVGGDASLALDDTHAQTKSVSRKSLIHVAKLLRVDVIANLKPLTAIVIGAAISSVSCLWLVADTSILSAALFVFTLSCGEALWSPQFYIYTSEVAPEGQAGVYFALSNFPMFLPKVFGGVLSGRLLQRFCSVEHCEEPSQLWFWIFATTVPFSVGLLLLKRWIDVTQPGLRTPIMNA
eukprot:m.130216 g.130216  ORF g.130216 m.130216 type:complete len:453 (+) comp29464_c0_seq5:170-1528(+)